MKELSHEAFSKIRDLYWVLQPCYRDEIASVYNWVFSPNVKPYPVPNQSMPWRRPTYEEAQQRQTAYEENSAEFIEKSRTRSEGLHGNSGNHWYVSRAERQLDYENTR